MGVTNFDSFDSITANFSEFEGKQNCPVVFFSEGRLEAARLWLKIMVVGKRSWWGSKAPLRTRRTMEGAPKQNAKATPRAKAECHKQTREIRTLEVDLRTSRSAH